MSVIQGIYIALFGRPADPGGLAYWNEVTKNGADLSEMLRVLPATEEYTSRFEGQTPDQVITSIYLALFNREPDPEGLAFFKEQLASGAQNMATIAVNILQGAQGDDKADIEAKVEAAELFTASLDTEAEIEAYKGADAAALAKKFIDTVDKDNKPTADAVEKAADAVAAGQDPTGGQAPVGGGGGGGGDTPSPPTPLQIAHAEAQSILAKWRQLDADYGHIQKQPDGNKALFNEGGTGYDITTAITGSPHGETLGEAALGVNLAIAELGIQYAKLISAFPSVALTSDVAKEGGGRLQTVHDNILGSISSVDGIGLPERNFPAEIKAALDAAINAINDGAFANRPLYSGNVGDQGGAKHDAIRAFDWSMDVNRNDWVDKGFGGLDVSAKDTTKPTTMWAGFGIDANSDFVIARHEGAGIELALRARERFNDTADVVRLSNSNTFEAPGGTKDGRALWSFDFSVATGLNGSGSKLADFDIYLNVDIDPSAEKSIVSFKLSDLNNDGTFEAFRNGDRGFIDNEGEGSEGTTKVAGANIAQNSQNISFAWINQLIDQHEGKDWDFTDGEFSYSLSAYSKGGVLLTSSEIVVLVGGDGSLPVSMPA